MRILHIDTGREMRGGQWQVLYLLEGLAAAGHQCALLTPLAELRRSTQVDVRPLSALAVARLSRAADLTHAHDARAHTLGALLARSPLVVARRVAFPIRRGPLSRFKYARAARYIAISEHVKQTLLAASVAASRISVVYDGVPLAQPRAAAGGYILAPATEDPRKGTALLRQTGLEVRFSDNLARDLPGAAAFAYITYSEGLGSAVLLAMAHGVPVVASRVPGLTEIIEDARTGLMTPNQPEAIAAALTRLLEDRDLARRLVEAAWRQVEQRFSVEVMVRNTLQVYREVLAC